MEKKRKVSDVKILKNEPLTKNMFEMTIEDRFVGKTSRPGQFVNVQPVKGTTDPLLRIPLGIHKIRENGISLLYKVVGPGTKILSGKKTGETINILGPLGNGFDLENIGREIEVLLVSGGYGISPLFALAQELANKRIKTGFFIGARDAKDIVCKEALIKMCDSVSIVTDNGTCGTRGCVTDILTEHLEKGSAENKKYMIFACGPEAMIEAVSKEAEKRAISAQVTKDEYMACGIGACRGCAVETKEGIKLSCTDGPVFDSRILIW